MPLIMSLPTVDLEAIDNLRALSPDDGDVFLNEILTIFIADTPARIAELHKNLAAGDRAGFSRAAHSIKGSSSNIGASALHAIAERMELQSRAEGLAGMDTQVAELEAAFEQVRSELKRLMAK